MRLPLYYKITDIISHILFPTPELSQLFKFWTLRDGAPFCMGAYRDNVYDVHLGLIGKPVTSY